MAARKILIENLPPDVTEAALKDIFAQIGEVLSVKLNTDLFTQRPNGRGLVEMTLDVDAFRAVNCFDGATVKDRRIHLSETMPLLEWAKQMIVKNIPELHLSKFSHPQGGCKQDH